jgi:hypothetical protein
MYILLNLIYIKRFAHLDLGYKLNQVLEYNVYIYMLEAELLLLIIIVMTSTIFSISSGVFSLSGTLLLNPWCFHVTTPLWPSVGVKPNTWKSWRLGVLRDSRMFRARQQGEKHLALGCSWCHWKGLET